jgi:ABC-type branched-subunit amino acid transport system substrate-binding protein
MVDNIKRRKFLASSGAIAAIATAGCTGGGGGGGGSGGGDSSRTIKQGYLLPLTGDLGSIGVPMKNGGMIATDQIANSDISYEIDTQVEDTKTAVPAAIDGANALVNAGYPMMTGSATSNIEIGNRVFVPKGMVACSPSNTLPTLSNFKDEGLFFRTTSGDQYQGFAMAQAAAEQLEGVKTAATTYINDDYGQLLSQWFTDHFEQTFDGTVQSQVVHDPTQSSYTSKLQTALKSNPGLFVVITYPQSGVQLFRDYYSGFNSDRPIMLTDGAKDPTLPKKVGNQMSEVVGTMPAAAGPAIDTFESKFKEEYGNPAIAFTAQTYDSSAVTILANAAAGENNGAVIADQMENVANPGGAEISIDNLPEGVKMAANGEEVQYKGAGSNVDFDKNGDLRSGTYEIWNFKEKAQAGIERLELVKVTKEQALSPGN